MALAQAPLALQTMRMGLQAHDDQRIQQRTETIWNRLSKDRCTSWDLDSSTRPMCNWQYARG
eukprot:7268631-Alexandrium_andersonii.AAC.1